MDPIDLAALARALDIARQDPLDAKRIDAVLAAEGPDAWTDLAMQAAFRCQMKALGLHEQPWRSPPMTAHIEAPRKDEEGAALLARLLRAGLSRYEPDPMGALARAEPRNKVVASVIEQAVAK